jgi:hypothetical protein
MEDLFREHTIAILSKYLRKIFVMVI